MTVYYENLQVGEKINYRISMDIVIDPVDGNKLVLLKDEALVWLPIWTVASSLNAKGNSVCFSHTRRKNGVS